MTAPAPSKVAAPAHAWVPGTKECACCPRCGSAACRKVMDPHRTHAGKATRRRRTYCSEGCRYQARLDRRRDERARLRPWREETRHLRLLHAQEKVNTPLPGMPDLPPLPPKPPAE